MIWLQYAALVFFGAPVALCIAAFLGFVVCVFLLAWTAMIDCVVFHISHAWRSYVDAD